MKTILTIVLVTISSFVIAQPNQNNILSGSVASGAISGSISGIDLSATSAGSHSSSASANISSGGNAKSVTSITSGNSGTTTISAAKSISHTIGSVHTSGNSTSGATVNNITGAGSLGTIGVTPNTPN